MKPTSASVLILAVTVSAALVAQIPERAQWEITFAQVEAAAGLPDLRTAGPGTVEARVMEPRQSDGLLPFLRLSRSDGVVRAQYFLYWAPGRMDPRREPESRDSVCRDGVCVKSFDPPEQPNWGDMLATLVQKNACPASPAVVSVICSHCDHLWIKTTSEGKYREQSCPLPSDQTPAGALLLLMKSAAKATR